VFVSAIFIALLASGLLTGYGLITRAKPDPAERYRGLVQYAPNEQGQCERFEFDNRTGFIWPQPATQCEPDAYVPPSHSDEALGPLGGVRDYFRSH
jgi:hypothetical protein